MSPDKTEVEFNLNLEPIQVRPIHLEMDIQGNHFRGIIIGVILGFPLGLFVAYASISIAFRLVGRL